MNRPSRSLLLSCLLVFAWLASPGTGLAAPASIADFAAKAQRREPVSVVFFGGSLTWGANASDPQTTSYRGRMMRWLQEQYPQTAITFHDAAIGGSGSMLGQFRLERDVLVHKPDLVLLDFTVNDGDELDMPSLASYERVLRDIMKTDAAVLPVLMLFKWHATAEDEKLPPKHEAHVKLATAYGLPVANVLGHVQKIVKSGTSADVLWDAGDGAHPGDTGYLHFFEAVRDEFIKAREKAMSPMIPEKTVYEDLYPTRRRFLLTEVLPQGWAQRGTYRTSLWFDGLSSRWMGDVATATAGAAPLEVEFTGSMVGIFGERSGLTPAVKIWIDNKPVQPPKAKPDEFLWKLDTARFAPPRKGSGNLFLWQVIATGLSDGKHTLRIEPVFEGADKDAEFRIESVCSAGASVATAH